MHGLEPTTTQAIVIITRTTCMDLNQQRETIEVTLHANLMNVYISLMGELSYCRSRNKFFKTRKAAFI